MSVKKKAKRAPKAKAKTPRARSAERNAPTSYRADLRPDGSARLIEPVTGRHIATFHKDRANSPPGGTELWDQLPPAHAYAVDCARALNRSRRRNG